VTDEHRRNIVRLGESHKAQLGHTPCFRRTLVHLDDDSRGQLGVLSAPTQLGLLQATLSGILRFEHDASPLAAIRAQRS
jgi:hypothetical protein